MFFDLATSKIKIVKIVFVECRDQFDVGKFFIRDERCEAIYTLPVNEN